MSLNNAGKSQQEPSKRKLKEQQKQNLENYKIINLQNVHKQQQLVEQQQIERDSQKKKKQELLDLLIDDDSTKEEQKMPNKKLDFLFNDTVSLPSSKVGMRSGKEHKDYLRKMMMSQEEIRAREHRFQNRKSIDYFLKSILNLDIIDMFNDQQPIFEKIPDNFPQGHMQYLKIWDKLFKYETYNVIVNSKRSEDKISTQYETSRRQQKTLSWVGFLIKSTEDQNFVNARLYDKKPSLTIDKKNGAGGKINPDGSKDKSSPDFDDENSPLRGIKESDLLIISTVDLIGQSKQKVDDIKKLINPKWLKLNLLPSTSMFAYVSERSKRGSTFLEVKIDISKSSFIKRLQEEDNGYIKVYCYQIESLSTRIREYRTLRMSEFYGLNDTILNPNQALCELKESIDLHPNIDLMKGFMRQFGQMFNPSQREALMEVTKMVENQLLLIQGPPGAGKTHTITGIISMLIRSGVNKILVCAPSNAAVDEIITRINLRGLIGLDIEKEDLHDMMIRIGSMDYEPSPNVKPHTLDQRLIITLNKQMLHDNNQKIGYCDEIFELLRKNIMLTVDDQNHKKYLQTLVNQNIKKLKDFFRKCSTAYEQKTHFLNIKQKLLAQNTSILQNIDDNKQSQGGDWKYAENQIILKAKIICSTLSMSGVEKFDIAKDQVDFLIIDEACQCIEPSTLIPFDLGPKRVIIVGDQNQLPATTFSDNSERTKFSRSFFERLLDNGYQKCMLSIQYRMEPVIRQFPSITFYDNKITDDKTIFSRAVPQAIKQIKMLMNPMVFFDLKNSSETLAETSKSNADEAYFTLQLIQLLKDIAMIGQEKQGNGQFECLKGKIGIITPYKSQVKVIKDYVAPWLRTIGSRLADVEVNTVDAYQGREKDIIIFNCVRSNQSNQLKGSLGFLVDKRRMNVAITRAKHFLFVVGNSSTLKRDPIWKALVDNAQQIITNGYYSFEKKQEYDCNSLKSQFITNNYAQLQYQPATIINSQQMQQSTQQSSGQGGDSSSSSSDQEMNDHNQNTTTATQQQKSTQLQLSNLKKRTRLEMSDEIDDGFQVNNRN